MNTFRGKELISSSEVREGSGALSMLNCQRFVLYVEIIFKENFCSN